MGTREVVLQSPYSQSDGWITVSGSLFFPLKILFIITVGGCMMRVRDNILEFILLFHLYMDSRN